MKKILSLILCLVLACTMLVACSEETIGDGIGDYPETSQTVERLTLNMYIITGDDTSAEAMSAVASRISGHTKTMYNTVLNITFVKESEYQTTVTSAINNGGVNAPHIILINSESMFDSLNSQDKLANLTDYYQSKYYASLNTQITSSLLQASKVDGKYYTVPNNRVLGEYKYLVIDKSVAHLELKYSREELESYKSLEDAAALMADMADSGYNAADLVRVVTGPYELKAQYEKNNANFCNIIEVPKVTRADAFASAFAVVKNIQSKYNDRAMQIIYNINTDVELRNFLQYGVLGANYEVVDGDIVRIQDGSNTYSMNLCYTGDVFKANACSELYWTNADKEYGKKQNADSIFVG